MFDHILCKQLVVNDLLERVLLKVFRRRIVNVTLDLKVLTTKTIKLKPCIIRNRTLHIVGPSDYGFLPFFFRLGLDELGETLKVTRPQ